MGTNNLKILLYFFLFILGSACHSSGPVKRELALADSLMEENPDTAMYLLQTIVNPEIMSEEEYAIYCLLTTQAADLTNVSHTSDELITVAVNHFKSSNNLTLRAKSHYYMARVKEDMQEPIPAEEHYLLAATAMEKTKDYKQTGAIYTHISEFYLQAGRYEDSHAMQQKAYNNYLLAAREERNLSPFIIFLPIVIISILLFFLIRYQLFLRKEKKHLEKQEKQLSTARVTIETQRTELNHLKRELKAVQKNIYNSSGIVQKVRMFNNIPVTSKEKPTLTELEWNQYLNILDETFGFVSSLRKSYHKLTDIDIRICALLREGISTAHISTVMSMTPDTLSRRMQRIKSEKMNKAKSPYSLDVILQDTSLLLSLSVNYSKFA
ncbi:tetratricopeptide repeat protein [Bacteroides sp. 519]|uniref:transcriptional regulator n=1 Tax=Bacteroides sp. 519 TaxID=2302937 RepID=UPI0013D6B858|nr:tetratricopeptide repeat protein [Bacteroides sp. 519]NDV59512.1 hypothetical protein [Bacteroides sp. 519]